MALLECKDLSLGYPGRVLVTRLNFTLDVGQCLCVLGGNGVGKSTLVRTLLRLHPPLGGAIVMADGLSPCDIGYLPQQSAIPADFPATVQEVVRSGCLGRCGWRPFYGAEERERTRRCLERLGLTELRRHSFRTLSGGQRQRVLLARALCAANRFLLLDEPAAGLDPAMQDELYGLVTALSREDGMGILMVSHDLSGAIANSTHVLNLSSQPFWGTREEYLSRFAAAQGEAKA